MEWSKVVKVNIVNRDGRFSVHVHEKGGPMHYFGANVSYEIKTEVVERVKRIVPPEKIMEF